LSITSFLGAQNFRDGDVVPFFLHDLGQAELNAIHESLKSPLLTTGPKVALFESSFASYLGVEHSLCVSSCTAAMHLALEALGVGPGHEVLVPNITFAATALAVLHTGAKPVLVDTDPATGLLNLELLEQATTPNTRAVIPVHLYGQMVDMARLTQLAQELKLLVVEDAAHCIEGVRDGIRPGQLSDAAAFSFFATKNITCGEGGALATRHQKVFEYVRASRTHGMTKTSADRMAEGYVPWDIPSPGWKYNMSDIQASMLIPQLGRISVNLGRRQQAASRYDRLLENLPRVRVPMRLGEVHALHLYAVLLDPKDRESCMTVFRDQGIQFTVNYEALSTLSSFRGFRRFPVDLPVSSEWGKQTLSLPFYPSIPVEHVERVCSALHDVLQGER
jgi:dTDP-4-amino-4,6-dideoxygalactose transaminase